MRFHKKHEEIEHPVEVGVFERIQDADLAIQILLEEGYSKDDITVICPKCGEHDFEEFHRKEPSGSHTVKGVASGGAIGAVLGGLIALGAATTGGAALLFAGGLLAGMSGGAVAGGFVGAMLTRGFEPEVADLFDQALDQGKILVAVEGDAEELGKLDRVQAIFAQAGAEAFAIPKQ